MKVFRLNTELFLDYDLEYINIDKIDNIKNYEINDNYYIIIIKNKFLIKFIQSDEHTVLSRDQMNKITYNFLKSANYDDMVFFKEFEYHEVNIRNHDQCYM